MRNILISYNITETIINNLMYTINLGQVLRINGHLNIKPITL